MPKQMMFDEVAHQKIKRGVDTMANTMKITLGPTGKNVIIDKTYGVPEVVKDGNTVSKEIELEDPFENMGAKMIAEAASKTADVVGDGTATASVLAQAIYEQGLRHLTTGVNSASLKKGIDQAVATCVAELNKMSVPVKDKSDYQRIATIAANHDAQIGNFIADAMEKSGKEGVITVEEGKGLESTLEFTQGLEFDKGYISPYFVNKVETLTAELEEPYILIYDKKISNVQELLPLLEKVTQVGKPLLIIAEEIEGEALTVLVVNKLQGVFASCAVKAPAFGDRKKAILEDIAILTGGRMLSEDLGIKLENVQLNDLGQCRLVRVAKEKTTVMEGRGEKSQIEARMHQLRNLIKETSSDYDREKYEERLAKLVGGVALLKIGGATETVMKERKALTENAVHAAQAARDEGILPGGGVAYLRTIQAVKKLENSLTDENKKIGVRIVAQSLESLLKQIVLNTGKDGTLMVEEVKGKEVMTGFDAATGQFVNMIETGIIDPTKVLRLALQNAASVAGLMLTSRTLLTDLKNEEKKKKIEGSVR